MMKIIIHGCNGKMGQVVADTAAKDPEIEIVAGIDRAPNTYDNPFPVYETLEKCPEECDVIIDFSLPKALPALLEGALSKNSALVIATTGFSPKEQQLIEAYSKKVPIFQAANMSIGINLMQELAQKAAQVLGDAFDIEIIEKHHNEKIDSPSGTAYALANSINEVFLNSKTYVYGRHSKNDKRTPSDMGIHSIRGGTIVGEHTVIFAGNDEVVQMEHTAYSKQIFAVGALRAAKYMMDQGPGLYGMKDVMDTRSPITNISTQRDLLLVSIKGMPKDFDLISALYRDPATDNSHLELISQTCPEDDLGSISFALGHEKLSKVEEFLKKLAAKHPNLTIGLDRDIAKITVQGLGLEQHPMVAAKVFELLSNHNIPLKAAITSGERIDCFINGIYEKQALETLIENFGL